MNTEKLREKWLEAKNNVAWIRECIRHSLLRHAIAIIGGYSPILSDDETAIGPMTYEGLSAILQALDLTATSNQIEQILVDYEHSNENLDKIVRIHIDTRITDEPSEQKHSDSKLSNFELAKNEKDKWENYLIGMARHYWNLLKEKKLIKQNTDDEKAVDVIYNALRQAVIEERSRCGNIVYWHEKVNKQFNTNLLSYDALLARGSAVSFSKHLDICDICRELRILWAEANTEPLKWQK